MNGQDKPYVKPVSSLGPYDRTPVAAAAAALATSGGSNGTPSGAIAGSSWLKDMMMMSEQVRVAQTGIASRAATDNPNMPPLDVMTHLAAQYGAAATGLHHQYHGFYPGVLPSMQQVDHCSGGASSSSKPAAPASTVTSTMSGLTGHMYQSDSLEKAASAIPRFHPALETNQAPAAASSIMKHSLSARHSDMPASEPHAKRQKTESAAPISSTDTLSSAAPSSQPKECTESSIPHRPSYFQKGSIIQLGDNKLKRIEDLETRDFEASAQLSSNLCIDCSTVINIKEEPHRGTAFLTFSIGDHLHDQVRNGSSQISYEWFAMATDS